MKKVFKYGKSSKLKKCREMIDEREKKSTLGQRGETIKMNER